MPATKPQKKITRRVLAFLTIIYMFASNPGALLAVHSSCNCWDGDYICAIHNDDHEVIEVIYFEEFC